MNTETGLKEKMNRLFSEKPEGVMDAGSYFLDRFAELVKSGKVNEAMTATEEQLIRHVSKRIWKNPRSVNLIAVKDPETRVALLSYAALYSPAVEYEFYSAEAGLRGRLLLRKALKHISELPDDSKLSYLMYMAKGRYLETPHGVIGGKIPNKKISSLVLRNICKLPLETKTRCLINLLEAVNDKEYVTVTMGDEYHKYTGKPSHSVDYHRLRKELHKIFRKRHEMSEDLKHQYLIAIIKRSKYVRTKFKLLRKAVNDIGKIRDLDTRESYLKNIAEETFWSYSVPPLNRHEIGRYGYVFSSVLGGMIEKELEKVHLERNLLRHMKGY